MDKVDISKYEDINPIKLLVIKSWHTFQRYGFWITLAILIGVWAGITASKTYYTNKMDEIVQVGGMLHKQKVYTITLK